MFVVGYWTVESFWSKLGKIGRKGIRDSESIVVNHIAMNVVVRLWGIIRGLHFSSHRRASCHCYYKTKLGQIIKDGRLIPSTHTLLLKDLLKDLSYYLLWYYCHTLWTWADFDIWCFWSAIIFHNLLIRFRLIVTFLFIPASCW